MKPLVLKRNGNGMKIARMMILAIGMMGLPCPGETAMEAMTNDSLHLVQGDAGVPGNPVEPSADTPPPPRISKDGTSDGAPRQDELARFDTAVRTFEQSHEYATFSTLLQQVEAVASRQHSRQWLESAEGFAVCSSMAGAARHCRQQLSRLETTIENDGLKRLVETKRDVLSSAVSFYDSLCDFRQGKSPPPDLVMLVSDIRSRQSAFEKGYAGFQTEKQ
ncbi:MAG: hypothetical protein ACOZF0_15555 [Thermodesulfobacteriota bacterium]